MTSTQILAVPTIKTEDNETQTLSQDDTSASKEEVKESLRLIEDLKFFLATAPANWQENQVIRRYYLNHDEGFVSCVFWNNLYFITGTDIVRCIVYKFQHFGRKIIDRKKFEEGIFSDLRNLKCDTDAILESPRSDFLDFLFKNSCLRTQKKQKVFFWFNVPHDKLMADALERDFKKEKLGQKPTTIAHREPAKSFDYDDTKALYTQLADHMEIQKQLNETVPSPNASTVSERSPEYSSSTTMNNQKEQFDFLEGETPSQFEANPDYEDDFPLDYFDPEGGDTSNDFITLDSNFQAGVIHNVDENYDTFVDPSIFTNLINPTPTSNQLVFNGEYLIEQTQPLKTPQPPKSASNLHHPISASNSHYPIHQPPQQQQQSQQQQQQQFYHQPLQQQQAPQYTQYINAPPLVQSASQDFFPISELYPNQPPPSATFQRSTSNQHYHDPVIIQSHPQAQYPQQSFYQNQDQIPYNLIQHEPEYWQPQLPHQQYGQLESQLAIPMNQSGPGGFLYVNEQQNDYLPQNNIYYMDSSNSINMNTISNNSANGLNQSMYASPSQRQQQISANMMKKKRQMQQQRFKNNNSNNNSMKFSPAKSKSVIHNLDETINNSNNNKSSVRVSFKNDSIQDKSENLIPTPESSITNPDNVTSRSNHF